MQPFEHVLVDPQTKKMQRVILGGNVLAGHKFQVPVKGGVWKCGHFLVDANNSSNQDSAFCVIGEAVAPGFDFCNFTWVTDKMVKDTVPEFWDVLKPFLHN